MGRRGRKSVAELVSLAVIPRRSADDRAVIIDDPPSPPSHLGPEMKTWWAEIVSEHALGSHQLLVLRAACQAWDRMEQARKVLACSGLSYTDDKGMHRAMPEVAIERDSRTAFVRAVRELNLKLEPPKGSGLEPAALYR